MKVNFYNEKIWIMSLFMKRCHKDIDKDIIFREWCGWWPDDFLDDDGEPLTIHEGKVCLQTSKEKQSEDESKVVADKNDLLDNISKRVISNVKNLELDEIKSRRMRAAKNKYIPADLARQAQRNGLLIRRSFVTMHLFRVSGYTIIQADNPQKVIAGSNGDLTIGDVENILKGIEQNEQI